MHTTLIRTGAALTVPGAALALSACGGDTSSASSSSASATSSSSSAPTPSSSSASPSETASTAAASAEAPLPTATASESPTAAATTKKTRVESADRVFSVEMPAGWTQNATSDDKFSSITLNAPDGGNMQILSLRYSKPQQTITKEFSRQRDAIVEAFPSCKFPYGANVIRESLGGKMDANYRDFTCDSMPFTDAIFTANGPGGEMLAGHDAYFGADGNVWKDVVRSVVTNKKK